MPKKRKKNKNPDFRPGTEFPAPPVEAIPTELNSTSHFFIHTFIFCIKSLNINIPDFS